MVLERIAGARYSLVRRAWAGRAVAVFGGGPSLTADHVEAVRLAGLAAIAVNDAYRLAPWAQVCYFADSEWWAWHSRRAQFAAYQGQKCSVQNSGANIHDDAVHLLRNRTLPGRRYGLSSDPGAVCTARNSGYQALNLAVLAGASSVLLLGFDGQLAAVDGRTHWFGEHPRQTPANAHEEFRRAFADADEDAAACGVRVINCSLGCQGDAFRKMDLFSALSMLSSEARA